LAVANYQDAKGHYPTAYQVDADGKPIHSWRVDILPYIEHETLFRQYRFSEPWDSAANAALLERMPKTYVLHGLEKPGNAVTNYLVVVGDETAWPGPKTIAAADIKDGTTNTIMIVENRPGVPWMSPRDLSFNEMDFTIPSHRGVSSRYVDPAVVMFDGAVRRLKPSLSPEALRAMCTIRGGEKIGFDETGGVELLRDGRDRPTGEP